MISTGMALAAAVVAALLAAPIASTMTKALRRKRRGPTPAHRRRGLLLWLLPAWVLDEPRAVAAAGKPETAPQVVGRTLCTLQLQNDADAPQRAHFVTPMFGQGFRQGDIPAGQHPQFLLPDGRVCQTTLWGISSWPDGSMKFCAAMILVPAAVPAKGQLAIQVRSDRAAAGQAGTRSLAELQGADMQVLLNGVSALDGTWKASLNDGIRRRTDVVQIATGPAGAVWRVGSEFRDATGAAHGQLYCWHYVAGLNDASGSLAGMRYLGRVAQPWTDVSTPPAGDREFSAVLQCNGAVVRKLLGHTTTETPGETIRLSHYASFFTADTNAQWDYVQGGGSTAKDCTIRVVHDTGHWIRSRLVPPYAQDLRIGAAPETGYYPMGRGTVTRGMGNTGERPDIGVLPDWNVLHLLSQAAAHERVARVNAMVAAGWRLNFRKKATLQPVPCVDLRPQYVGLGEPETKWRGRLHMGGMTIPKPDVSMWREDTAHRPGCIYWPYLFTGEPQYLDLLLEHGFAHMLEMHAGNGTVWGTTFPRSDIYEDGWQGERGLRIGINGKLYKGSGLLLHGGGGTRITAWRSRDVVQAAAIAPDIAADRTEARTYLRDVIQSAYAAFRDYMEKAPASYRDSGLFVQAKANGAPWQVAYLSWSVCHQSDILGTPDAAYVRNHLSRFWSSFAETADIGCLVAYTCLYWGDDDQLARSTRDVLGNLNCILNFKASTARVSVSPDKTGNLGSWKPHDGDVFQFFADRSPELTPLLEGKRSRRLYAVNCQGQSFQLAAKPEGAPLAFAKDATATNFFARLKELSPDLAFSTATAPSSYSANIRGAVAYHRACGDTVDSVKSKLDKIVEGKRIKFDNSPKYCVVGQRE